MRCRLRWTDSLYGLVRCAHDEGHGDYHQPRVGESAFARGAIALDSFVAVGHENDAQSVRAFWGEV